MIFLQAWEMLPYLRAAAEKGYTAVIVEPNTKWKKKVGLLFISN